MRAAHTPNALPATRAQMSALLTAAGLELGWGLRTAAREVRRWRRMAAAIPDPAIRRDALSAIDEKRGHLDGAAMFCTLARRRDAVLQRALVRYELLQDFLDSVSEPGASLGPRRARPLYRALADALDLDRACADYFVEQPGPDDGGYLTTLVAACRAACRQLPSHAVVRAHLKREAHLAEVLLLNHEPSPVARGDGLRRWAAGHRGRSPDLPWYELAAAASGWITTHALLALAGEPGTTAADVEAMHAAYFPWLAMTLTLLDSYVDRGTDAANGDHNYLSHFASDAAGIRRLQESIQHAARSVRALPNGERHAVLLACMIALYLSKDSARTPELRATTAQIAAAGGSLTQLLLPVLRAWRICNGQRSAT